MSALEAINHPWLKEELEGLKSKSKELVTPKMIENLRNFSVKSIIQKEVSHFMVQIFRGDSEEIERIE